jgi:hypothetical protein
MAGVVRFGRSRPGWIDGGSLGPYQGSHEVIMRIRQTVAVLAAAAAVALTASAASAFKIENKDASGYDTNFNLEEQAKNFRRDGSPSSTFGPRSFSTPYGNGSVELSVKQGPSSGFGPGWGFNQSGSSGSSAVMREHFNRIVTPEGLR